MAGTKESLLILTPLNFKENKHSFQQEKTVETEQIDKYDPQIFCRTCANMDSCLVPIFKDEGLEYSLNQKIEKYLPIQVSEADDLPVQLCYHCASTLIAWDSLLVGCVEAEKKLNSLRSSLGEKQCEGIIEDPESFINESIDTDDEPLSSKTRTDKFQKLEEKRDILQEKNDPQVLDALQSQSERYLEEPVLSFSTYQHQFTLPKPLILEILSLRIENPECCHPCAGINKLKLGFVKNPKSMHNSLESEGIDNVSKKLRSECFTCDNCGKILSSKFSLRNHMKSHCDDVKLSCSLCGKLFRHRFNLLRHLRVIHEGVRNHICVDCGKRYRSHGEMEDHRNIHSEQSKIICEECGRVFLTKASFYPHRKSHRLNKMRKELPVFDCEECHKKFTTKKSRNQHLLIHTGEKPLSCGVCGKSFRTKANYAQHAKVHSDVKPFGCEHCGKFFGRKDHLRIHVRCHTGEKPFVCNFCGRGFAQMNDMKKHCRIHNKKG